MKIAEKITDLIGNTPLMRVGSLSEQTGADIVVKIESFNPMSSVKDRIALGMVEDAEARGLLKSGMVIVEATSGNTGIGLALVAASKGYRLILTMPASMSVERRQLLKALGVELVLTDASLGMKGSIGKAMEILEENPGAFMPGQFDNPANPQTHRKTTSQEILRDTENQIDFFVAGIGTGGTITGVGEVLKERIPSIKIIAVEPQGSAVLSGEKAGPHKLQGIGAGFVPKILNTEIYDEIVPIRFQESEAMMHHMAQQEGLLIGISSGAALAAAVKIAELKENKGKRFVVLLPDSGERYLSTGIFED